MILQLLPGVRSLRTAIVPGWLWMLAVWLWHHEKLTDSWEEAGPDSPLTTLLSAGGFGATLAALSGAAYFVGSLWNWGMMRIAKEINAWSFVGIGGYSVGEYVRLSNYLAARSRSVDVAEFTTELEGAIRDGDVNRPEPDFALIDQDHADRILRSVTELELVEASRRLILRAPQLYEAYDRHRAEAEIRVGMFVPGCLSAFLVANELGGGTYAWLVFGVIAAVLAALFVQGLLESTVSNGILASAVADQVMRTPFLDALDRRINGMFPLRPATPEAVPDARTTLPLRRARSGVTGSNPDL